MVRTGGVGLRPLRGAIVPAVHLHAVPVDAQLFVVEGRGVLRGDGVGRAVGVGAEPTERPAGVGQLGLHLHRGRGRDGLHRLLEQARVVDDHLDLGFGLVGPEPEHQPDDRQDHQQGGWGNALHGNPPERSSGNVLSAKYLLVNILRL